MMPTNEYENRAGAPMLLDRIHIFRAFAISVGWSDVAQWLTAHADEPCPAAIAQAMGVDEPIGQPREDDPDRYRGLYAKFRVTRIDLSAQARHEGCDYFVLDLTHDKLAISAIDAYEKAASLYGYNKLAEDLRLNRAMRRAGVESQPIGEYGKVYTPSDPPAPDASRTDAVRGFGAGCSYCSSALAFAAARGFAGVDAASVPPSCGCVGRLCRCHQVEMELLLATLADAERKLTHANRDSVELRALWDAARSGNHEQALDLLRAVDAIALWNARVPTLSALPEREELERLRTLINTPGIHNFTEAVMTEAIHQRERWGSDHDAGKTDADWFWLIGYLAGKALHNPGGDTEKKLHRIITVAAAARNWHAAISGESTVMRPGTDPNESSNAE